MQFFTALLSVLVFAASTTAAPNIPNLTVPPWNETSKRSELIVVSPPIKSPSAGSIWLVKSTQLVTWDTTTIPPSGKDHKGIILLGYIEGDSESEHLDYKNPLASNFPLTAGSQSIVVPDVPPRDNYIVVLLGDSGNISPLFSIVAGV